MDTLASFPSKSVTMMYMQFVLVLCAAVLKWHEVRNKVKSPSVFGLILVALSALPIVVMLPEFAIYVAGYPQLLLDVAYVLPIALNLLAFVVIIFVTGTLKWRRRR